MEVRKRLFRVVQGERRQSQRRTGKQKSVVLQVSPQGAVSVGTVLNSSRIKQGFSSSDINFRGLPFLTPSEEGSPF